MISTMTAVSASLLRPEFNASVYHYEQTYDSLSFLDDEFKKAQKSGVFGATGPDVGDQHRDDQAEEIEDNILWSV